METVVDVSESNEEVVTLMDNYKEQSEETEDITSSNSGFNSDISKVIANQPSACLSEEKSMIIEQSQETEDITSSNSGSNSDISKATENQPSACLSEDKSMIIDQKESYIESNHIINGLHTTSEEPKSDELSTQSIIQESEPVNCDMKASLTQRSDDNDPTSELEEDGEGMYIKNKRLKITEPSNSNIKMEEANSSFLDLQHTPKNNCLDSPCFSGRTSEKMEIAVDGTSLDIVEKPSKCLTLSQIAGGIVDMVVDRAFAGGKKLLVLDVNGLLVDISPYVPYDYDPDEILVKKAIFKRPYCDDFLKFCFEKFNVGVWSSRRKQNIEPILDFLFGNDKAKLLFHWDQSYCTYTGFYTVEKRNKPLILKKLNKLWDKYEPDLPWEKGVFNESNTLLIDDSPYKALCNPQHTAIFPNTYRFRNVKDNSLGPEGDLRVYLEGLEMAENVREYVKQNPFGQRAITEKNLSWGFYLKIIEANASNN